jgi:hypothetical protein
MSIYETIITKIFEKKHSVDLEIVNFSRDEITDICVEYDIRISKNIGDLIYSYKCRRKSLPSSIKLTAPIDKEWIIRQNGSGLYQIALIKKVNLNIADMEPIYISDRTPKIVKETVINNEQSMLAICRYNKILEKFVGENVHLVQSHLRTNIKGLGQIEIDELFVSHDGKTIFPVQAKNDKEKLNTPQTIQDIMLCEVYYPQMVCRPVIVKQLSPTELAFIEMGQHNNGEIFIKDEKHYKFIDDSMH